MKMLEPSPSKTTLFIIRTLFNLFLGFLLAMGVALVARGARQMDLGHIATGTILIMIIAAIYGPWQDVCK
jgi:uncharacterized membrane protein